MSKKEITTAGLIVGVVAAVGVSYVGYRGLQSIFGGSGEPTGDPESDLGGNRGTVGPPDEYTEQVSESKMQTADVIAETANAPGGSIEADFNAAARVVQRELSEYQAAYMSYAPLQVYTKSGIVVGYSEGYQEVMNEYSDVIDAAAKANALSQQLWGYDVFVIPQNYD